MNSNSLMPEDDSINIFFEGMHVFRSRWNVLNERCKKLEASLQEAIIEKEQLQAKLNLSRDYTDKIEKEKEELAVVVKELHNDLQQNSLLKWIETLGEKLSVLNKSAPTIVSPRVIDDITLFSSDDENDSLPNDDEETSKSRRKESCKFRSKPNSTTPDVTDHDYPSPNNSTPSQTTASAGSEVSVVDTTMSIENSLRRDSNEDQSLNDARADRSDEISPGNMPTSSHNSPLIVPSVENDEPSADIEERTTDGDFIPENEPLLSQEFTLNIGEESSSSSQKEQYLDTSHDFLVGAQPSSKPLSKRISPTKNGKSPEIQSITLPENLPPLNVEESEPVTLISSKTVPQINVEESESPNECENTNIIENSETSVDTSDPPQLISIADMETCANEKQSTDSANDSVPSPPSLIVYSSECIPNTENETRIVDDIEITNSSRDATGDTQQAVESFHGHFLDSRDEILDKNGIDFHVSMSDEHVHFTNEALLEQGVNHEEIHPAEETPSEIVSDTEASEEAENADRVEITHNKDDTMNGEKSTTCDVTNHESDVIKSGVKSTNQGATPEELICQIFGSPMTSTDHEEVVCLSNEPSDVIDLNLSDEESIDTGKPSVSIVQPELTVNLPRIFPPEFKVTEESVNTVISYFTSETKTADSQTELSNSKRSSSPSSSALEPKAKRSSPCKSTELDNNLESQEKKKLKCLICKNDLEFDFYSALDSHIIAKHPNPYPSYFRCHYGQGNCTRHFSTTKKVNDHVRRRHLGEDLSLPVEKLYPGQKPWRCSICDKIFAHSSHLRGHLRHTHNVTETEGIAKYEFKMHVRKIKRRTLSKSPKNGYSVGECVICLNDEGSSDKFKTYQDLDEHIFRNHPNPYPFYLRCPFCKNENVRHFKGLSWLNNHIQNNHSSKVSFKSDN